MLLQRLEDALLLQPSPGAKQLPVAFVAGRARGSAQRHKSLTGVEIHAMDPDDRHPFAVVSIATFEHPRQLCCQLRHQDIGVVNLAEAVLQCFDVPDDCQVLLAEGRICHIYRLKNLESVAQAFGGDTQLMQFDDTLRISDGALIVE